MRGVLRAGALLAVVATLSACGPAYRGEPLYGPLRAEDPRIVRGERLFSRHCHACHPGGAGGLAPALNDKPLPGSLIRLQVRAGFGAMPAFGKDRLSDGELDAIVAYLLALRAQAPDAGASAARSINRSSPSNSPVYANPKRR